MVNQIAIAFSSQFRRSPSPFAAAAAPAQEDLDVAATAQSPARRAPLM
jgi:hypothetical protein